MQYTSLCVIAALSVATATTYFKEEFGNDWADRWVVSSEWKPTSEMGEWKHTAGKYYEDENDKGIQTGDDARFYGLSADMGSSFNNEGKDLVIQFTVKHEQDIDCGGAYIKLMPSGVDQKNFGGDTEYALMFGPDICGYTKRTHVIFTYKGENLLKSSEIKCESDTFTHLYTLIVKADNTYTVKIDNKETASGSLADDWDFLEPKEIKDPEQSKPTDWVDERMIPDPESVKPEGHDDIPEEIPEEGAEMPDDWDEEDDGEWEPPMVSNPEFTGEWHAEMIENPEYKGEWEHPMVANPDFVNDETLYHVCKDCTHVGFELWQVKAGTIFDDIIVTDDIAEAEAMVASFETKQAAEKAMDAAEKEQEKKVREMEEAMAAAAAEKEAEDEADELDEDLEAELHEEL